MPKFDVDYSGKEIVYSTIFGVEADTADDAEDIAYQEIKQLETDLIEIEVEAVRELNN